MPPVCGSQARQGVLFDLVPSGVTAGVAAFRAETQRAALRVVKRPVTAAAGDTGSEKPLDRVVVEGQLRAGRAAHSSSSPGS